MRLAALAIAKGAPALAGLRAMRRAHGHSARCGALRAVPPPAPSGMRQPPPGQPAGCRRAGLGASGRSGPRPALRLRLSARPSVSGKAKASAARARRPCLRSGAPLRACPVGPPCRLRSRLGLAASAGPRALRLRGAAGARPSVGPRLFWQPPPHALGRGRGASAALARLALCAVGRACGVQGWLRWLLSGPSSPDRGKGKQAAGRAPARKGVRTWHC